MNYVFGNGRVFVGDSARSWAQAVGVSDGSIVAVGSDAEVRAAMGPGADFIDAAGKLVIAGFQDAHVHPMMGGLNRLQCNLEDVDDAATALDAIASYAETRSDDDWILGGGWRYGWFQDGNPPAALLDAITDLPVFLVGADGHSAWANTAAMRRAGIESHTLDPTDGRIERLADGTPQGTFHEGAMDLFAQATPPPTEATMTAALLEGQRYLLSLGITGWQDAWIQPDLHNIYRTVAERGELKAAVRGCLWWERDEGIEQLDRHIQASTEGVGTYDPRTVKVMLDGVCENHTASMLDPYRDGHGNTTENRGIDFIDPGDLPKIVTAIDRAGLQVHFHALGDRGVRNGLDAIAVSRAANGWMDTRPHLAHLQVVDPTDVPRFRQLGATANAQPLWAVGDDSMVDLTLPFLTADAANHQYPWRSLLNAGATLAMGSDWSVSTPDVMAQVDVAVHRNTADAPDQFLPTERIGLADALMAFTAGSAYINHRDLVSGSIEVGKRADIVLLDNDPFECERTAGIGVELTMINGEVIYTKETA